METKEISLKEKMINNSKILWLMDSLRTIDDMINRANTDSTIDVEDLRKERRNCVIELKKLRKQLLAHQNSKKVQHYNTTFIWF